MARIHITRIAELRKGDVLVAVDGKERRQPLEVQSPLGPIGAGDVQGVRFVPPQGSELDWVFHPTHMDGQDMEVERSA